MGREGLRYWFKGVIISVISVYTPQCGVDDSQKDDFYESHINYEDQHEGNGYGVRNKEGKEFLSFVEL